MASKPRRRLGWVMEVCVEIRPAGQGDRQALSDICLQTASGGLDGTRLYSRPELPGLVWAAPYLTLEPELAFVLAESGYVLGYVVATADTTRFAERLDTVFLPPVRARLADFAPATPADALVLRRIQHPDRGPADIVAAYPAHLHINLLPPARGRGFGRQLMQTELAALAQAGAARVHLGVGLAHEPAQAFYRALGFRELSRGQCVYMGRETVGTGPRCL